MMRTQNIFFIAVIMLIAGAASAAVLNQWTFEEDAIDTTLSEAINSGIAGAVFSPDTTGVTLADGDGGLICANDAAGDGGLWTDGAILFSDATSPEPGESLFLRYDLEYDMTSPSIDSGTLLALSFADTTSSNLAGVALRYRVGEVTPPPPG
jgi:hypothetical protein